MIIVLPAIIKYFVMVLGNTMNSHKTFLENLTISTNLREVSLLKDSNVIIAFVPIVSRAGTDISAVMEKIPEGKPVVLVVLHHTFDPYYIAPDSRLCVKRESVFAVDCLYYEDQGFLRCLRNDEAIKAVKKHLRLQEQANHVSYNWNTVAFFAVCIVAAVVVFVYIIGQVDIISIIVGIAVVVGGVVIIVIVIDRSAGRTSAHKPADKKQWRETTTSCSSV
ncbi:uncharacterized protein Hap1MRO34_004051 isoform 2-T2 [Clarias gariepinus]|uniref:uncharacterized protein LOC128518580 isoform X2 n=1 Tax=Clarias gariepinus TaxID=13013 RepID=UPI00234E243F|nr:uncharacterized protein LOC128518580 isoform X2 [Clarias gariepinus]